MVAMTVHHREVGSHIHVHLYAGHGDASVSQFAGFLVLGGVEWDVLREALTSHARGEDSGLELELVQDLAGDQLPESVARAGVGPVGEDDTGFISAAGEAEAASTLVDEGVEVVLADDDPAPVEVSRVP